jgi:hypothetical protein
VVGILPKDPVGTVRARAYRLRSGGLAPVALTISAPNDAAVAVPTKARWFSFDVRQGLNATTPGSFDTEFPQWDERGCLIEVYDDADVDNWDVAKVVFGGGEDQIDAITGADHRNLSDIYDLLTGSNVWMCLTGYNYTDTGAQATDTLEFAPFLLKGGQQVVDRFLRGATVAVYEVDGASALFTITDAHLETSLTTAVNAGNTSLEVVSTAGFQGGDVIALDDELVTVTSVVDGTHLAVARGSLATVPASHTAGTAVTRSAADARGIFKCQKVGTAAMTVGNQYTVKVSIGYKNEVFTSTHQFTFVANDV